MIFLLIIGLIFFVITTLSITYFMFGYSAMLEDIVVQSNGSEVKIPS